MIMHALRVGLTSRSFTGLMHDSVEDGWWPAWLMWPALDAVTRRPGEVYAEYIDRCGKHPVARRVKIADLKDNLSRGDGPPGGLAERYRRALRQLGD